MLLKIVLYLFAAFCFLHIVRDYLQITKGYDFNWFTRIGHIWHRPQYEVPGMVVFFLLGITTIVLALRVK